MFGEIKKKNQNSLEILDSDTQITYRWGDLGFEILSPVQETKQSKTQDKEQFGLLLLITLLGWTIVGWN